MMKRSRKHSKRDSRKSKKSISRTQETLIVGGLFLAILLFCIAVVHFYCIGNATIEMQKSLEHLRIDYDLTTYQVEQIRELEWEYHGSGSPFTRRLHNKTEDDRHEEEIGKIIGGEKGQLFLRQNRRTNHGDSR